MWLRQAQSRGSCRMGVKGCFQQYLECFHVKVLSGAESRLARCVKVTLSNYGVERPICLLLATYVSELKWCMVDTNLTQGSIRSSGQAAEFYFL
jgi:hypothetical protein